MAIAKETSKITKLPTQEYCMGSFLLRVSLHTRDLEEDHIDDRQDEGKENRHTETANLESRCERAHEEDDQAVDNQGKESKRQDIDRQSEKYQERLNENIGETQYNRRNECARERYGCTRKHI